MGVLRRAAGAGILVLTLGVAKRAAAKRRRSARRERLNRAYAEAARDPVFLEEMSGIDREFSPTLADGLRKEEVSTMAG